MIAEQPTVSREDLQRHTGWEGQAREGCKGEVCVPLRGEVVQDGQVAPCVRSRSDSGCRSSTTRSTTCGRSAPTRSVARALTTAVAPDLVLPDFDGRPFALSSLRGRKVVLKAWASW